MVRFFLNSSPCLPNLWGKDMGFEKAIAYKIKGIYRINLVFAGHPGNVGQAIFLKKKSVLGGDQLGHDFVQSGFDGLEIRITTRQQVKMQRIGLQKQGRIARNLQLLAKEKIVMCTLKVLFIHHFREKIRCIEPIFCQNRPIIVQIR